MEKQSIKSSLAEDLQAKFSKDILEISAFRGDLTILVPKQKIHSIATELKTNPLFDFDQMIDLTAVDYLEQKKQSRFQVVYHLLSLTKKHRLRIKCDLDEQDAKLDSIAEIWLAANWYERECFDMYGIIFEGHPNLKRILLYSEFEGHPLRKDYPMEKEQPLVEMLEIKERYDYLTDRKL